VLAEGGGSLDRPARSSQLGCSHTVTDEHVVDAITFDTVTDEQLRWSWRRVGWGWQTKVRSTGAL
jgi:hypothetical protein